MRFKWEAPALRSLPAETLKETVSPDPGGPSTLTRCAERQRGPGAPARGQQSCHPMPSTSSTQQHDQRAPGTRCQCCQRARGRRRRSLFISIAGPIRPLRGRPDTMLTAGSSSGTRLQHGGTADLCQECRRRCAALRGGCCSGVTPSCLVLSGPSVAELGSCMTAVSIALSPMRPCGVQIV